MPSSRVAASATQISFRKVVSQTVARRRDRIPTNQSPQTAWTLDTNRPNSNFSYPAAERLELSKPVTALSSFYRSSVGKKMIVALTGVILIAFIVGHLLGNLQIFLGPEWVNSYAEKLRALGPLLWVIRVFLLVTVLLHIFYTISLALENRRARPRNIKDGH